MKAINIPNRDFGMKEGERLSRSPNKPTLSVIAGAVPYLWVGNNAENDMACFATIEGRANLLRIADAIHKALGIARSTK